MKRLRPETRTIYQLLQENGVAIEDFCIDWMFTLFASSLPIKTSRVIWDCFLVFGEGYLISLIGRCLSQLLNNHRDNRTDQARAESLCELGTQGIKEYLKRLKIEWIWREMFYDEF